MIRTMYQFGLHLQEVKDMESYFQIAAAPYPEKATDECVLVAEISNRKFKEFGIETYTKRKLDKYLFRELAASRATSLVPTLHFYYVPGSGLDNSCDKFFDKFERCLESNKDIYRNYFDINHVIEGVRSNLKNYVEHKFSVIKNYLFTLRIDDYWLGDIPEIKGLLENASFNKYFRDGKGDLYVGKNKTCAVTYQTNQSEVWGRVDTLGFTVNDISFSRSGFNAKDSYKMFPVSPEAVKVLEGTMRALDKRLSFNFSGLKFFVLPHFVTLGDDVIRKKDLTKRFVDSITGPAKENTEALLNGLFNSEQIFNSIINDPELGKNSVYYDIFFYEEKQAQFAINLHVSDVLPSRFRVIQTVKAAITKFYTPITYKDYKQKGPFIFTPSLYLVKDYFAIKKEKKTIIEPYFFKIVEAIFYKNKINEEQVLRAFMQKIIPAFKNHSNDNYAFDTHVRHSFCIHQFFQQLQLFDNMELETKEELASNAIEFVAQHQRFFDHHLKKAAFFLGSATEKLLNHQDLRYKGNKPFMKHLLSLYIDFKGMGEIFHKLRKKADEYANDRDPLFRMPDFNKMLVSFGEEVAGGDSDKVSKTEISYAFSLGMTMEKEFRYRSIQINNAKKEARIAKESEPQSQI